MGPVQEAGFHPQGLFREFPGAGTQVDRCGPGEADLPEAPSGSGVEREPGQLSCHGLAVPILGHGGDTRPPYGLLKSREGRRRKIWMC